MKIKIIVGTEIFIKDLPHPIAEHFMKENTFLNPKREVLERLGKWTGATPKFIYLWRKNGDWISLPRGYSGDIQTYLLGLQADIEIEYRTMNKPWINCSLNPTGELFDYQETALQNLMAHEIGTMESPTGSGKTNILLTLIARLKVPTLIVVHTTELMKQTVLRCKEWLNFDPGIIGAGKEKYENITVGMIQTLSRMNIDNNHPIYNQFGCVIVDECHHSSAMTWAELLRRLPCQYKYGFTATAWRKDKMEFLIWRMIGPITAKVRHEDVADAGRIIWPDVEYVNTNYWFDIGDDPSQWTSMITDLTTDEPRNWLIIGEVRKRLRDYPGTKALILTDRIEHAEILHEKMRDLDPVLLTGALKQSARNAAMERIRAGTRLTIATIHLLGEGIDVPGWDLLFLVSPISGGPRTLQAVGRIARPAPGKEQATLIDFVDSRIHMLKNAARSRATLYRNKGKK